MKKVLATLALTTAMVAPAFAQDDMVNVEMPSSMLTSIVENALSGIDGMDIDVSSLSQDQLSAIFLALNSDDGDTRDQIRAIVNQ